MTYPLPLNTVEEHLRGLVAADDGIHEEILTHAEKHAQKRHEAEDAQRREERLAEEVARARVFTAGGDHQQAHTPRPLPDRYRIGIPW